MMGLLIGSAYLLARYVRAGSPVTFCAGFVFTLAGILSLTFGSFGQKYPAVSIEGSGAYVGGALFLLIGLFWLRTGYHNESRTKESRTNHRSQRGAGAPRG